ncbi:MAG TPA: hypothetical protein VJA87_03165 [Candidatus Paceibacterota bacterium]
MTTQVSFTIDSKLKELAMKKARKEGTTLSAVLRLFIKAYVDGKIEVTQSSIRYK